LQFKGFLESCRKPKGCAFLSMMVSNKNLAFKEEKIMRWWKDSHWKDLTYL
jgi:hypothetical protein